MSVKVTWQPRHTLWLVVAIVVAGTLLWFEHGQKPRAAKPLDRQPADNAPPPPPPSAGADITPMGYPALSEYLGPFPVVGVDVAGERVIVSLRRGEAVEAVEMCGLRLDAGDAREPLARWLEDFVAKHPQWHIRPESAIAVADGRAAPCWMAARVPGKEYQPINELLVVHGLVRFDRSIPDVARFYLVCMAGEQKAQELRRGLWSTPAPADNR